jgi:transglutaminase-like putative cysteine protease
MIPKARFFALFFVLWFTSHLAVFPDFGPGEILPLLLLVVAGMQQVLSHQTPAQFRLPLLGGVIAPLLLADGEMSRAIASGAAWVAGCLILFPLSRETLRTLLLCAVLLLATLVFEDVAGVVVISMDSVLLLYCGVATASATPPQPWRLMLRLLRVAIPAAVIITVGFQLFPTLARRANPALVGYVGRILAGDTAFLRPSNRTAMVVKFESQPPKPTHWYWRGETLAQNRGLTWEKSETASAIYSTGQPVWRYSILTERSQMVLPLDYPLPINPDARSSFSEIPRASSSTPPTDPPNANETYLHVPSDIAEDPRVARVVQSIFKPSASLPQTLENLGSYFREGKFVYTRQPGKIRDLGDFLTTKRRGYCEHYAAVGANLLRLAGIPARTVTGFRGGQWNPWLRTITVKDSDAHAWIEAWDADTGSWLRFDAVDYIAPDLLSELQSSNDPARWPWHRMISALWETGFVRTQEVVTKAFGALGWWLVAVPLLFLIIRTLRLRARGPHEPELHALRREESRAAAYGLARATGETPLAWLSRLASSGQCDPVSARAFAKAYEIYRYAQKSPGRSGGLTFKRSVKFPAIRWNRLGKFTPMTF